MPQVLASVLERSFRLPPELLVRPSRVRRQIQNVAWSSTDHLEGQVPPDGRAERFDHVEHGAALSCAQVPGSHAGMMVAEVFQRDEVALGKVKNVDVVADGSAVGGLVVCPQNDLKKATFIIDYDASGKFGLPSP